MGAREVRELDDDVATFLGDLPELVEPEHLDDDEAARVAVARLLAAFPGSVLVTDEVPR